MNYTMSSILEEFREMLRELRRAYGEIGLIRVTYLAVLTLALVCLGIVSVYSERLIEAINNHGKSIIHESKRVARRGRD